MVFIYLSGLKCIGYLQRASAEMVLIPAKCRVDPEEMLYSVSQIFSEIKMTRPFHFCNQDVQQEDIFGELTETLESELIQMCLGLPRTLNIRPPLLVFYLDMEAEGQV